MLATSARMLGDIHDGDAIVDIRVIAVRLIEGVRQEAEAHAVALDHRSGMGGFRRCSPCRRPAMPWRSSQSSVNSTP